MTVILGCVVSHIAAVCLTNKQHAHCPPNERVALVMPLNETVWQTCWKPLNEQTIVVRLWNGELSAIPLALFEIDK